MPQPVDLPSELMRVTAAERVRQITERASLAAQQRASAHQQEEQVRVETQVHETVQPERAEVDSAPEDRKRRRGRSDDSDSDKASRTFYDPDEKPRVVEDDEGHRIDISV